MSIRILSISRYYEFYLPNCYYTQPPTLKTGHLSRFGLETLFYIFHQMPADSMQAYAASELYARNWKYHEAMELWFRDIPADEMSP